LILANEHKTQKYGYVKSNTTKDSDIFIKTRFKRLVNYEAIDAPEGVKNNFSTGDVK